MRKTTLNFRGWYTRYRHGGGPNRGSNTVEREATHERPHPPSWRTVMGAEIRSGQRSRHWQARITKYQSFKGTKREAQIELVRLMDAVRRGDYIDPSKVTVAEFLDRWEKDWAANNVSPKTRERFAQLITHRVQPHRLADRGNCPAIFFVVWPSH